jgi:hypothetical protein
VGAAVSALGSAAAEDDSKKPSTLPTQLRGATAVLALGVVGGVLLCLVEVLTVVSISAGGSEVASQTGSEQHGLALLVLGVAALVLAWLAGSGRAGVVLAALAGLGTIGVVALLFWALGDLPDTGARGTIGMRSEPAQASPAIGFWVELAAAVCLMAAAGVGLLALTPWRERGAG